MRSYTYDGAAFTLSQNFAIPADLEGITQDASGDVYVMAENDQQIRRYDLSGATPVM